MVMLDFLFCSPMGGEGQEIERSVVGVEPCLRNQHSDTISTQNIEFNNNH